MAGITIAQMLAFTPIAFMILAGVLRGVSPSLEEAAPTLRAGPWRIFRTVTWPLLRPGLTNAFLIGFVESLADFANPLVIGGNFNVLSTDIFFAVVGAAHDQGRAAVLALMLLGFTLAAFALQRWWLGRARYTTVSGKGDAGLHRAVAGWPVGRLRTGGGAMDRPDDRDLRQHPRGRFRRANRPRQHPDLALFPDCLFGGSRRRRLVLKRFRMAIVPDHDRTGIDRDAASRPRWVS